MLEKCQKSYRKVPKKSTENVKKPFKTASQKTFSKLFLHFSGAFRALFGRFAHWSVLTTTMFLFWRTSQGVAKYKSFLGLVTAYAFDGIEGVAEVTKGATQHWNLVDTEAAESHPRFYDVGMCLEVLFNFFGGDGRKSYITTRKAALFERVVETNCVVRNK